MNFCKSLKISVFYKTFLVFCIISYLEHIYLQKKEAAMPLLGCNFLKHELLELAYCFNQLTYIHISNR